MLSADPLAAAASSPGKVLVAGGYLILERPHTGAVVATDARFRSLVRLSPRPHDAPAAGAPSTLLVEVHSPQFREYRRYLFGWDPSPTLQPLPRRHAPAASPNRYVENALLYSLSLVRERLGEGFLEATLAATKEAGWHAPASPALQVVIAADNPFYSQTAELHARGWPVCAASLRKLPPMLPPREEEGKGGVAKTGLGSSATLVTSLSAAILHRFGVVQARPMLLGGGRRVGEGECNVEVGGEGKRVRRGETTWVDEASGGRQ